MKQKVYSLLLATALLSPILASANEGALRVKASTTPIKPRIELEERREEMKDKLEARKASTTVRRVEMQQGLAKRKAEQAGKVLLATIERLEKIVARVDSRIAKVKATGRAVAESEAFSAQAKAHLSLARQSLEAFSAIDLTADKAQTNFSKVREAASAVKMHIREAHTSLMKATRSLMGFKSDQRNATSTTATSTSQ